MKFKTYIPCDILKPYVKSFAIQETEDAKTYKVLPGTGLVIGFQYKGKLSRLDNQKEIVLSASGVSGLADHYKVFKSSANIGSVLVFFKEAGASIFFRQPLHELFRESISLDNFMLRSELLLLEEQLGGAKSDFARIEAVEKFLVARMTLQEPDKLVLAALALIHKNKGNIRIKELIKELHTSQSPLEKRFRQAVGASPKKFASIVRLKNAILQYDPAVSLTGLSYEAGFYDQAHFIKEFKTFTGDTPEAFLLQKTGKRFFTITQTRFD
ncbi:MAG: helix-turn-helix domain-containing protein [Bacteroidota bacterium]